MSKALDTVLDYHQRTKHRFDRYAAGPGGLDWANQPYPFRVFDGCPQVLLPLLGEQSEPAFSDLYVPHNIAPRPLTLPHLATLLELAYGLSAWKQYGDSRWALRCNPSSGNLHPTEAYVVSAGSNALPAGIHHYRSREHLLEQRCAFTTAHDDLGLPPGTLLVGLTSIHWREAWKYGERAYRYCQHDVGHAVAALRYAAASLGWRAQLLEHWADDAISALLGCDRAGDFGDAEPEHPDLLIRIDTGATGADLDPDALLAAARAGQWRGRANRLSGRHGHHWPLIDRVADACRKPCTAALDAPTPVRPAPVASQCNLSAAALIRQRRSAQAFDGSTTMRSRDFFRLLDMTLPRPAVAPWDAIRWTPRTHLLLFVHRVEALPPGLYLLPRSASATNQLKSTMGREFSWQPVNDAPAHLELTRLLSADAREAAQTLSCHQEIAADGAFSLAMLAEYGNALQTSPWRYRHLFWEAGMLGHVLYLEAEAAGLRGTGIGCYFDDGVHDLLALSDRSFQSLYHFTVGGPLTDDRLQTLPPYAHLPKR